MNILIPTFLTGTSPSGVVTYYQTLARELRGRDVSVQVVETTDTPFVWNKSLNILGHVFKRLGQTSRILWDESSFFLRLYLGSRQHRNQTFDLIHAQDVRSGVAAYFALGKRVPVVLTAHFNDDPVTELITAAELANNPLPAWLIRGLTRWYRWLFAHVDNYIFVSNYAYTQSKHLLHDGVRRAILPNTVTIDPADKKAPRAAEDKGKFIISNVGYVDERKNQELLIRIGAKIKERGVTDFQIWLIGDGPKRAEYERLVAELDLAGYVRFFGRQSAPWRLVAQSDIYVHTALNDNCPYALLEAFAVNVPVLALPVGGIPELMPHGAGLVSERDPAQLARLILSYRDDVKRNQLIKVQSRHAETYLSHEAGMRKLLAFYDDITTNKYGHTEDTAQQLVPTQQATSSTSVGSL
ncbi:glycosyltransferase family 4 protein [uncultured Fibrella sp.]|uniref:glycosyltransferase family 4 protein n=1 Tax=uncultured Fibrella sp. TaxID=1284596 RepID=UPI0035CAEE82